MDVKYLKLSEIVSDFKFGLKNYDRIFNNDEKSVTLKELLIDSDFENSIKSGATPSKFNKIFWGGEHEFVTMSDIDKVTYTLKNSTEYKLSDYAVKNIGNLTKVPKNAILISNAMTIGLAFLTDRSVYINQNVFWLKIDENKANPLFLTWYFNLVLKKEIEKVFTSKYLSKKELSQLSISIPNINEQNIIAKKIEIILQQIKEIMQNRITPYEVKETIIFHEVFSSSKNIPIFNTNAMSYGSKYLRKKLLVTNTIKTSNLSKDFRLSTRFYNKYFKSKEDELSGIPTKLIGDISLNIRRGSTPKYVPEKGIPVVKTAHLRDNGIKLSCDEFVSEDYYTKRTNCQLAKGDLLIASTGKGSLGNVCLYLQNDKAFIDSHITAITLKNKEYSPKFLSHFLQTSWGIFQFERAYVGATNQIEIYPAQISNFVIPDLSRKTQDIIVEKIEKRIADIERDEFQLNDLLKKIKSFY